MRKLALFALLLISLVSVAQTGKVDIYTGAVFQHNDGGPNFSGWELAGQYNLNSHVGIVLDGAGTYSHGTDHYLVLGPSFTLPSFTKHISPFVGAYTGFDWYSGVDIGPNFLVGGGFDIPVSKRVSIRAVNINYYLYRHSDTNVNSLWYSGGLVFHF